MRELLRNGNHANAFRVPVASVMASVRAQKPTPARNHPWLTTPVTSQAQGRIDWLRNQQIARGSI